jgi:hypothetical protein
LTGATAKPEDPEDPGGNAGVFLCAHQPARMKKLS